MCCDFLKNSKKNCVLILVHKGEKREYKFGWEIGELQIELIDFKKIFL